MEKNPIKITENDFFIILERLPLSSYKVDAQNNNNYYIHKGYKYVLHTNTSNNIINNYYKIKL